MSDPIHICALPVMGTACARPFGHTGQCTWDPKHDCDSPDCGICIGFYFARQADASSTQPARKIHRVQVDFTERGYAQLLELQAKLGYDSVRDVCASALRQLYVSTFGWRHSELNMINPNSSNTKLILHALNKGISEALDFYTSHHDPEIRYNLVFHVYSDQIRPALNALKIRFEYVDPDTTYEADTRALIDALVELQDRLKGK